MPAIVLLAKPRAGAHGFYSIVENHPEISVFTEIFHDGFVDVDPWNFFGFVLRDPDRMKRFCVPYYDDRLKVFGDYLEYLRVLSPRPNFMIDVKYNAIRHMDGIWKDLHEPPDLLRLFVDRAIPLVHLVRYNVLKTLLSETRAVQTGLWVVRPAEQTPSKVSAVSLDIPTLRQQLVNRVREIDDYSRLLENHARTHTVVYEELFENGGSDVYSAEVMRRLAAWIGVKNGFEGSLKSLRISSGDLAGEVVNYDEVAATLRGTVWETLLRPDPIDWPALVAASRDGR